MRLTTLILFTLGSSVAWIVLLIATNFSGPAVGAGLLGALVLQSRAS